MRSTNIFLRLFCLLLLAISVSTFIPASSIQSNPLRGCTVDVTNQMICPGGFSTGTGGTGIQLAGSISGIATIVAPAVAGTPTLTTPTSTGTFVVTTGGSPLTTATAAANGIPQADANGKLSTGWAYASPFGFLPLKNATYVTSITNAGNGENDIYTPPSGKRAYVSAGHGHNTTGGTLTFLTQIKISGTYYPLTATAASVSPNLDTAASFSGIVLDAGESIAVNTSGTGLNIWFKILVFDDTEGFRSPKLTSFSTGDNLIYTVPALKSAVVLPTTGNVMTSEGGFFYYNGTVASRIVQWYAVPSGGSVGSTNVATRALTTSAGVFQTQSFADAYPTGTFISVNVDGNGAGQLAYFTVFEQ